MIWSIGHTWDGRPLEPADVATVRVAWGDIVEITIDAPFHGDPPPRGPAGPTDRLWEHEVVEWFVVGPGEEYTELELSPHGHHLLLRLRGVRRPVETLLPVDFAATVDGGRWRGRAVLPRAVFPEHPIAVNAFRIHGVGASRRYLAHAPAGGAAPDFHRLDTFARWP
jgi:hypothetical protein